MIMIRDDPYHSIVVRYISSSGEPATYDLFFVHGRYTHLVPRYSCFLSALKFPLEYQWIQAASRVLAAKPVEYGRGWFRWDEPIQRREDIPCRSVSSRLIDIVV